MAGESQERDLIATHNQQAVMSWIGCGLSMEDAMRLLYPKEAETMYSPDSGWCGPTPGSDSRY